MRSVGGYLRGQFSLAEQQQERSRAMANGDWRNEQDWRTVRIGETSKTALAPAATSATAGAIRAAKTSAGR